MGGAVCGRFIALTWDEVLGVIRSIQMDAPFMPDPDWPAARPNAFPGSIVPVIAPAEGGLDAVELRWGFEAPWDAKKALFNTRIETALDQKEGLWRDALEHGRCIVPTLGFFEPSDTETMPSPRTGKPIKRQYEFSLPGGLTLLAGIQDENAFSVMTTKPNRCVAPIHKRMPMVLREYEADQWLFGDFAALADRSSVELDVTAEPLPKAAPSYGDDAQMTLF